MIITIVGSDGAGKSTLLDALVGRLHACRIPARFMERWDIFDDHRTSATRFCGADMNVVRACAVEMPPPARFLFLMWVTAMAVDMVRDSAEVVVADAHWAKHAAGEIALGHDHGWVDTVVRGLPRSDMTLYLTLDPALAWERKGQRGDYYECGMDPEYSKKGFVRHQRRIQKILDRWCDEHQWVRIDSENSKDEVLDDVMEHVLRAWGAESKPTPRVGAAAVSEG